MSGRWIRFGVVVLLACGTAFGASPNTAPQPPRFSVGSNLVLVGATVLDRHNRPVRGLTREDFRVLDNQVEQPIQYFGEEETPVSLAIVFDTSGSMADKLPGMRKALASLLDTANPEDEFCLIAFADRPTLATPWTSDAAAIESAVFTRPSHGTTAMFDAIYLGLTEMRRARNPRRALVVFSDGGENASRMSGRELARLLQETDAQLYAIDMSSVLSRLGPGEEHGLTLLEDLCDRTGGRYLTVDTPRDQQRVADQMSRELRSQYVLGYAPSTADGGGKFHRIQVKLAGRHRIPGPAVFWRRGYRSPAN